MNNSILVILIIIVAIINSLISLKEITSSNVTKERKMLAFIIKLVHGTITASVFITILYLLYQAIQGQYNIQLLILLNLLYFIVLLFFTEMKMCILTIWYNNILNRDKCCPYQGLSGLFNKDNQDTYAQEPFDNSKKCPDNTVKWLDGNKKTVFLLILLNGIYLLKNK